MIYSAELIGGCAMRAGRRKSPLLLSWIPLAFRVPFHDEKPVDGEFEKKGVRILG